MHPFHFRLSGARQAIKTVWGPVSSSPACKPLIDHSRSGISRRPVIDNAIWIMVAEILTVAYARGNCRETFGKAWRVTIKSNDLARWKPEVLQDFNDAIAKKVGRQTSRDQKPDPDAAKISLKGPCHFGHTSSSQRANGREAWLTNPQVSWWPGYVTGGVTLCNQCYQVGYRAWQTLSKAPLPEMVHSEADQRAAKRLRSSGASKIVEKVNSPEATVTPAPTTPVPLPAIPLRVSGKPQRVNPTPSWGGTCVGDYLARPFPLPHPESMPSSMPSSILNSMPSSTDEADMSDARGLRDPFWPPLQHPALRTLGRNPSKMTVPLN